MSEENVEVVLRIYDEIAAPSDTLRELFHRGAYRDLIAES
jgi:hypothetical protein